MTVRRTGIVNTSVLGTNTLTYTADDAHGNTNTSVRTVIVRDTTPPTITWSFTNVILAADATCGAVMPDVTGTNFILATDLSLPLTVTQTPTNTSTLPLGTNVVVITVTDAAGNAAFSTNCVIVQDQTPPAITLNGANPLVIELGSSFTDPGAFASDACAGSVTVAVIGIVNTSAAGTNTLIYQAGDGRGNTNTALRNVVVLDTTPPTILWSFTNLVLAADTNCGAVMPDVSGTNYILATDLSGVLTFTQTPTNGTILPLGTNLVVVTVADSSGNLSFSTNTMIVLDQAPPQILAQPQCQTNTVGASASFSVAATACTPLAFQWFFNSTGLTAETNSTLTLSNLDATVAGNYAVVVAASGGFATSTVATLAVTRLTTVVSLTSTENPSGFKDSIGFTATVTPTNAAGTIQFLTNAVAFDIETLAIGQAASTNLVSLPRGTNVITLVYSGDANDLSSTNTLLQIVTNHPPTATAVSYSRVPGYPLNIALTNLATHWSDIDGDTVSLVSVGSSTNGVTVITNSSTLAYFNSNNVSDQFGYTIDDGWGGTNCQTVTIFVLPPAVINVAGNSHGNLTLNFSGGPGSTYILETATSLVSPAWQPIATNTLGTNGVWQFIDGQAARTSQRFYRLRLVP